MSSSNIITIYRPLPFISFVIYRTSYGFKAVCEQHPELYFVYIAKGKHALTNFKKKIRRELTKYITIRDGKVVIRTKA